MTTPKRPTPAAMRQAAAAARDSASREAALALLATATAVPALSPEAWALTARLHRDIGDLDAAQAAFGSALDAAADIPLPAWMLPEYAAVLTQAGRPAEAEAMLRAHLGDAPAPAMLTAHVAAMMAAGIADPSASDRLRTAILRHPKNRLLAETWLDLLRSEATPDAGLDALVSLQAGTDQPLLGTLLTLAGVIGLEDTCTRLRPTLERLRGLPPCVDVAATWAGLTTGSADAATAARVAADDGTAAALFFHFLHPLPRQLPLLTADPEVEAALEQAGVRTEAMRAFLAGFLRPASPAWEAVIEGMPGRAPVARATHERAERHIGYLDRMVLDGTLRIADPLTGEPVEPFDSFIAFGRTVYSFRGREWFLLVCGRAWSGAQGIVIPRLNLALPFFDQPRPMLGIRLPNVLATLLHRAAVRIAAGGAFPPAKAMPGPKRMVLSIGRTENFANHVWNYFSALDRMASTGALGRVERALFCGTEFFGPLEDLFPELGPVGVERPPRRNIVDPVPFDPGALVLPAGGFVVSRRLTDRLVTAMRRRARTDRTAVEPSDIPRQPGAPVIWIGLRLRDKSWVDQETACPQLIGILSVRFPAALFLLDGFSFPIGIDHASAEWSDVAGALRRCADAIRSASPDPGRVISMVGNTLRESVLWAHETDVYLAPYGSTQHKVGWFTDAPGLVYAPPLFTQEQLDGSPACTVAEISATPELLHGKPVSAGARRGIYRSREAFSNITLDVAKVADRLTELLERRGFRQSQQ